MYLRDGVQGLVCPLLLLDFFHDTRIHRAVKILGHLCSHPDFGSASAVISYGRGRGTRSAYRISDRDLLALGQASLGFCFWHRGTIRQG